MVEKQFEFSVAGEYADAGAFAWSPDGGQVVVLARLQRHASVFDVRTGQQIARLDDLAAGVASIDFDAQGRVLLAPRRAPDAALTIWDYRDGRMRSVPGAEGRTGETASSKLLLFSLDRARTRLAGIYQDGRDPKPPFRTALYDAGSWSLIASGDNSASALAVSPDGNRLALVAGGQIEVIDLSTGQAALRFRANRNDVQQIAWSPDGRCLATGTMGQGFGQDPVTGAYGPRFDTEILQLWDMAEGRRMAATQVDIGGGVESIDFSGDGRWLVTTNSDGTCRLWNPNTLTPAGIVADGLHPSTALARFSPDAKQLAILRTGLARMVIYHVS